MPRVRRHATSRTSGSPDRDAGSHGAETPSMDEVVVDIGSGHAPQPPPASDRPGTAPRRAPRTSIGPAIGDGAMPREQDADRAERERPSAVPARARRAPAARTGAELGRRRGRRSGRRPISAAETGSVHSSAEQLAGDARGARARQRRVELLRAIAAAAQRARGSPRSACRPRAADSRSPSPKDCAIVAPSPSSRKNSRLSATPSEEQRVAQHPPALDARERAPARDGRGGARWRDATVSVGTHDAHAASASDSRPTSSR